ncbi:MAG: hypothetical protein M3Z85_12740 [Acidobacteriota bacterium]|nr:hypothetical protein [Acidobacteriota bacterium]
MQATMEDKQALHQLIDELPGEAVLALRTVAELMVPRELEFDDEELRPEVAARLDAAHRSLDRGEGIPHAEVLREFGIDEEDMRLEHNP